MKLRDFQVEDVEKMLYFIKKCGGVYNASEMGCGKTVETSEVINQLNVETTVILSKKSMLYTWRKELRKWLIDKEVDVQIWEKVKEPKIGAITIIPYSIIFRKEVYQKLLSQSHDLLILDEAHALKNRKTQRTKAVLGFKKGKKFTQGVWDKCRYQICLSGTPFTNGVEDGFTLFNKLCPKHFPDFYSYVGTFCFARITPWTTEYHGLKNGPRLRKLIRSNFYFRRTKKEAIKELPDKIFTKITLPNRFAFKETTEERTLAEVIIKKIKESGKIPQLPQTWQAKRREESRRKLPEIIEFTEDLLQEDIPVVLFAYHREIVDALKGEFRKYVPAVITGDTDAKDREKCVKAFQDGETSIFIGQIGAAGEGITLTRGSTCIIVEPDYTPASISQAVDRLHRLGQQDVVNIYYFVAEGSIDEEIFETLIEKSKILNEVV